MRPQPASEQWQCELIGELILRYYFLQPAPTQWVAVGLLGTEAGTIFRVGCGSEPETALVDLRERLLVALSELTERSVPSRLVNCAA
ncbi:hypothetical protein [Thermomicrobium sp.]|jgi:hypothetical protein|uniref:hypothetical protein n=1 Tax=Thermomicrobium sp. TaxID=1969469 RepID=UPI001B24D977|nr:hypothetical protein [Thermomicrobium sp.]MBO9305723.1 hypothetical protein [Thermomicrobium sp.]